MLSTTPKKRGAPCSAPSSSNPDSPRPCTPEEQKSKKGSGRVKEAKDWEDARCPICMERPHNAVLLKCSSHDKGCRPYICNMGARHSNCLDQFCKALGAGRHHLRRARGAQNPVCPLCRGRITGFLVIEPARRFLDSKPRSCSFENCDFSGTYPDLRVHARSDHPHEKPLEVNPERQQQWRRIEEERERGDLVSATVYDNNTLSFTIDLAWEAHVDTRRVNFGLLGELVRNWELEVQIDAIGFDLDQPEEAIHQLDEAASSRNALLLTGRPWRRRRGSNNNFPGAERTSRRMGSEADSRRRRRRNNSRN